MTRTKWLRRALLGGAALGVMTTGAQADELAALKAQLEALQARVSQIETQPAPALPAGASLLTVRRGQLTSSAILPLRESDRLYDGDQGYTIAVTPTADMPAPVSEVTVSGQIRARLLYSDDNTFFLDDGFAEDYSGFDVNARGRLTVDGKTETAIGEVGGTIRLEGTFDDDHPGSVRDSSEFVSMDIAWGYWQMTPSFQLGGGYAGSTGTLQAGVDFQHNNDMTLPNGAYGFTNSDEEQIRITFQSGGLTFGVAVEDNDAENSSDYGDFGDVEGEIPQLAAYGKFDTGSFVIAAAASWAQDERANTVGFAGEKNPSCGDVNDDCADDWSAGIGINGTLGEMFSFTAAVAAGEGNTTGILLNTLLAANADDEWWAVSGGVIFSFATAMSLQLSAGFAEVERGNSNDEDDALDLGATLFWDPVDQLTLGLGVGWHDGDNIAVDGDNFIVGGFGAYFRF